MGAGHQTIYTMATGLPIHCYNIKNLMHGTSYNFKIFFPDLAISNHAPTVIQYYYREASAPLIQHVCVILAFESGSYGTPNTPRVRT